MTKFFRIFAVFAVVCQTLNAHAQLEPMQIPEGMDFECDEEWTITKCKDELAHEIWFQKYFQKVQDWKEELFFNTNIYFHPYEESFGEEGLMVSHKGMDFLDQGNLIDVRYGGFRKMGWAFAIEIVCETGWHYYGENCAPMLRFMDFNVTEDHPDFLPKSKSETAAYYGVHARWRGANLQSCKGALDHLLSFPNTADPNAFWHKNYSDFLKGKKLKTPDEIIVTADGDGVIVRARGQADPTSKIASQLGSKFIIHDDHNGGPGYQWALRMKEVVQPCLISSKAKPPWEKVLAAEDVKN